MDEDQKRNYALEQEKARADKAESELNAYKLKDETIRQASQRGISIDYLDTIDFSRENAESINKKLDIFEKTSKAEKGKKAKIFVWIGVWNALYRDYFGHINDSLSKS